MASSWRASSIAAAICGSQRAKYLSRSDVVIVADQRFAALGPGPEPTGHRRTGRGLVEQHSRLARAPRVFQVRLGLVAQWGQDVLRPDV